MAFNGSFISGFSELFESGIFGQIDAPKPFGNVAELIYDGMNYKFRIGGMTAAPIHVVPISSSVLKLDNVLQSVNDEILTMPASLRQNWDTLKIFWIAKTKDILISAIAGSVRPILSVGAQSEPLQVTIRNFASTVKEFLDWVEVRPINLSPSTVYFFGATVQSTKLQDSSVATRTVSSTVETATPQPAPGADTIRTVSDAKGVEALRSMNALLSDAMTDAETNVLGVGQNPTANISLSNASVGIRLFGTTTDQVGPKYFAVKAPALYASPLVYITTRKIKWAVSGRGLGGVLWADRWLAAMLLIAGRKLYSAICTSTLAFYDSTSPTATLRSLFFDAQGSLLSETAFRTKANELSYSGKSRKWKPGVFSFLTCMYWLLANVSSCNFYNELDLVCQIPELATPVPDFAELIAALRGVPDANHPISLETPEIMNERAGRFNSCIQELNLAMKMLQDWLKKVHPQPAIITPGGSNLVDAMKFIMPSRTIELDGFFNISLEWARNLWSSKIMCYNTIEPRLLLMTHARTNAIFDVAGTTQLNAVKMNGGASNYLSHAVWEPIVKELSGNIRLQEITQKGHYLLFYNTAITAFAAYMDKEGLLSKDFNVPTPIGDGSVEVE